jgi:hypothetical protein
LIDQIADELKKILADIEEISGKTGIPSYQVVMLLILRECVILNERLSQMREYLNTLAKKSTLPSTTR